MKIFQQILDQLQTVNKEVYFRKQHEFLTKHDRIDPDCTPSGALFRSKSLAIIGDLNLPQCKKYRVIQKLEILEHIGVRAFHSHWEDEPRCLRLMQLSTVLVFYRVPMNEMFLYYITEAKRLGLHIVYDIDDPVFDEEIYRNNRNLDYISPNEKKSIISNCVRYAKAMGECSSIIVSTPGMLEVVGRHVDVPTYLWRNILDGETLAIAHHVNALQKETKPDDGLVIGYTSGSRAHELDFRQIERVLSDILTVYPDIRLKVMGYWNLLDTLRPFADRIDQTPMGGYQDYLVQLQTVDISIIPLSLDAFNECKSAIRYLEASVVKVPTIASRVGDFIHVVDHNFTGILVETEIQWREALELLIVDRDKRQSLADAAYNAVLEKQSISSLETHVQKIWQNLVT